MKESRMALTSMVVVTLLGLSIAFALGTQSRDFLNLPVVYSVIGIAFGIQWLAFVPAYIFRTEKFFDLTGSITYIGTCLAALTIVGRFDLRSIIVTLMVVLWAARLGLFLFRRIKRDGKDGRFDEIKQSSIRFLNVWTIQGLWVTFTAASSFAVLTAENSVPVDAFLVIGTAIWLVGFAIEIIADRQKTQFKLDPENKDRFITTGLWSRSRHPNYVGETILWLGVAIVALPVLSGWQWVAMLSPVFVYLLLTKVSGVPLLEARADKKWGESTEYVQFKKETPVFWPKLF